MLREIGTKLKALHTDEQGADMVEYILIVAAIALPLLGVIIWFWHDISRHTKGLYNTIFKGEQGTDPDDLPSD